MVKKKFRFYCKWQLLCEPTDLKIDILKNANPVSINALKKDLGLDHQGISTIRAEKILYFMPTKLKIILSGT